MASLYASSYWLNRLVVERAVAAVYVVAFLVTVNQGPALIGTTGILPASHFIGRTTFWKAPSLLRLRFSDRSLVGAGWAGVVLSSLLLAGLPEGWPGPALILTWLVVWALYLSIFNIGQIWYSFGWESLLGETGFLVAFLGPDREAPPVLVMWLLRWLLFRLEFGAGLIKIRGDRCWRELTCLEYHHETQPMPGPLSWLFHHLPRWAHRIEVGANHVTQLVVPWLLFTPQPLAGGAAALMVTTQLWLVASGNFSWLNVLTIALGLSALDPVWLHHLFPLPHPHLIPPSTGFLATTLALTVAVGVLSWWPVRNMASRRQRMNAPFNPLHLVNTYGAFGSVTRERHEVIVEGTLEENPSEGSWREYRFKGKPGDPRRRPRQFAPYHLRLDWLMWFAAISPGYASGWFDRFVLKLLEADPRVLRLLDGDPFDGRPPKYVRAHLYRYRYSSWERLRRDHVWWERTPIRPFLSPVSRERSDRERAQDALRRGPGAPGGTGPGGGADEGRAHVGGRDGRAPDRPHQGEAL